MRKMAPPVTERARITVGADGMFSVVAKAVQAPEYKTGPALEGSWYAYFSGVPMVGWHLWLRPGNVIFAYNTNDNLSLIGVAFAARDLPMVRGNIEKHHSSVLAAARAGVVGTHAGRQARIALCGRRHPQPRAQAIRAGMGAGGRCRLPERSVHGVRASQTRLAALSGWQKPLTPV